MAPPPSDPSRDLTATRNRPVLDASQLIRSLLALPEQSMRVAKLEELLKSAPVKVWAPTLNRLAELAQTTDKEAREALLALSVLFASEHESSFIWALRLQAKSQSLLSLERMLRQPSHSEDGALNRVPLETSIPDYGTGRELTVGERRSLARRPTRQQLERLLLDPHPLVIEQLFSCPTITEADVISVITRRPVSLDAVRLIASSPRWISRRRVRLSLILNPSTPHGIAMPLVTTCARDDLRLIAITTTINTTLRAVARELHAKLPPVAESSTHRYHQ